MSLFARGMLGLNRDFLLAASRSRVVRANREFGMVVPHRQQQQLRTLSTTTTEVAPQPSPDNSVDPPSTKIKVRASNPMSYQRNFFDPESHHQNKNRNKNLSTPKVSWRLTPRSKKKNKAKKVRTRHLPKVPESQGQTLAQQLVAGGETLVPKSTWVLVEAITPTSTLDAMLKGIRTALDTEQTRGMIDLDAVWSPGQSIPCLEKASYDEEDENDKWVRKAKLVLSPFGRPTGWYLHLENRSVVYALLKYAQEISIRCSWREVRVRAYAGDGDDDPTKSAVSENPNFHFNDQVSDNTVRVESCPSSVTETTLMNFFSRYDLRPSSPMMKWQGVTTEGKPAPCTFLVHFADAAWARAAIREKQGSFIQTTTRQVVFDPSDPGKIPKPIRLVQYPKQIL